MPEMQFKVKWPDGVEATYYSPSLVIKDYFTEGLDYPVDDFLSRSRTALTVASERVRKKYGFPCSRALGEIQCIVQDSGRYELNSSDVVKVVEFLE